MNDNVNYRDIPGFPDYRVGSDGSVWSHRAPFGRRGVDSWRRLKQARRADGYMIIGLRAPSERRQRGKATTLYVHRLVLEAFAGPCPAGMLGCHNDGNPSNNNINNLRWDTYPANAEDSRVHGTLPRGSKKPNVKLHEKDIPLIRDLHARGFSGIRIANFFGVAESQIRSVLAGKNWNHVET